MRTSPVHECLSLRNTEWGQLNGMPIALRVANGSSSALQLFDLSALRRIGLKGAGAADWLRARVAVEDAREAYQERVNSLREPGTELARDPQLSLPPTGGHPG